MRQSRLSHAQLAHRSGVHRSTISRLLSGERRPSFEAATRLAGALGSNGEPDSPWLLAMGHPGLEPIARVERALRADEQLDDDHVRRLMQMYLGVRGTASLPSVERSAV